MTFEPATLDHVAPLAAELRECDRLEVEASYGPDIVGAIAMSIRLSDQPFAGWAGDKLVCVFGAAPRSSMSDTAAPWCLGTDEMRRNAAEVIRHTRSWVEWVRQTYPALINYVDARNTSSIRWLSSTGFIIDPAAPFGVSELPFHRFHMGLDDV